MTDQEIDKLRDKLGDGFEITAGYNCAVVTVSDIWKDVEFAECITGVKVDRYGKEIIKGNIYPIHAWFKREVIYIDKHELGWQSKHFKPSTESAYVEQLKAKAHELYGEIKDGDRFDRSEMEFEYNHRISEVHLSVQGWDYYKSDDKLYFGTICIYKQGKWAKRVDEPIRVNVYSLHYSREPIEYIGELIPSDTIDCTVHFTIGGSQPRIILKDDLRELLSKCLEDYLNKNP